MQVALGSCETVSVLAGARILMAGGVYCLQKEADSQGPVARILRCSSCPSIPPGLLVYLLLYSSGLAAWGRIVSPVVGISGVGHGAVIRQTKMKGCVAGLPNSLFEGRSLSREALALLYRKNVTYMIKQMNIFINNKSYCIDNVKAIVFLS